MSLPDINAGPSYQILGGGEMGGLIRAKDWSSTPLGGLETWPEALRQSVQICLNLPSVSAVYWGNDLHMLYNDAYIGVLAERHPFALAQPFSDVWTELWDFLGPQMNIVLTTGHGYSTEQQVLKMLRDGELVDTYWIYSFAPIFVGDTVGGIFVTGVDTTEKVNAEKQIAVAKERQNRILRQLPGFVGILSGADLRFTYANDALNALFGFPDVLGYSFQQAFEKVSDAQSIIQAFEVSAQQGKTVATRAVELRKHGREGIQYIDFVIEPILSPEGKIDEIFVGGYETTEVHSTSKALRANEAKLKFLDKLGAKTTVLGDAETVLATTTRLLGEHLQLSVCAYADMDDDENGFTIRGDWAAPGATSIVGHYSLADFGKLAVTNLSAGLPLVINDNLKELAPHEAATFQNIGIAATICMPLVKNGRLTALMATHDKVPRTWTDEELSLVKEVTSRSWSHVERVATVAALEQSEERLRLAIDNAEIGFWDWDLTPDGMVWPPRVRAMFGISPDADVTMDDFVNGVHPEDAEPTAAAFAAAMDPAVRASYDVEYRTIGKEDGVTRWVAAKGKAQFDDNDQCVRILGSAIDITERKRIELQLQDLNATLEIRVSERTQERDRTWNNARDLLLVIDKDGIFRSVNPAWTGILGWTSNELVGHSYLEFIHPDDHPSSEAALGTARQTALPSYDNRYRHKDGSYRWISWVAAPEEDLIYASGRDITDEKAREEALSAAQEALRQSQKMDAMGQLTGGVAHDFNNLLTPIVGTLDMLRRRSLGGEREQMLIDGAMQSADRAKMLVQRLLAFARRQPLQATPVDVEALVCGMADLISSTAGPQVRVVVEIADDLPPALADANQLEMALLNLGVNARDAMPDGGTLRITAIREADVEDAGSEVAPGNYIRLSVTDTGTGMDEETISRSVEPFFSTKGIGKGTGLGLSMVHGLAQQLGGRMVIQSKIGIGTNVELWLPVTDAVTETPAKIAPISVDSSIAGIALLVDDEDLVRISTADMLTDLGYNVVEAPTAEHALSLMQEGLRPDVVVTDHLMPGMNGTELASHVQSAFPATKILIISGYADAHGIAADLPRLTKPFRNDELATALAALARS